MGLHLMYVKHWTGDLKNIGVHEILAKDLGWEAYLAQYLHTIQCMQEPQVGKKKNNNHTFNIFIVNKFHCGKLNLSILLLRRVSSSDRPILYSNSLEALGILSNRA